MNISLILLFIIYNCLKLDLIDPLVFVSIIYIMMFFFCPIYDIYTENTIVFGVHDLFDYGISGSFYALLGYIAFIFSYTFFRLKYRKRKSKNIKRMIYINTSRIARIAFIVWCLCFLIEMLIIVIVKGYNISYILTLGFIGENQIQYEFSNSMLGFIDQATRAIVPLYLIYYYFGEKKILKYIMFILNCIIILITGFRYLVVIFVLSVMIFEFILENKRIRIDKILFIGLMLALIISMIGYTRNSMRSGIGSSLEGFTLNTILETIMDNFGIYKCYYAVIKATPNLTPYIFADQMIVYTAILFVPRVLWKGKPGNPGTTVQLYGLNKVAVLSGYAYPCLGEYYYSFGLIGIIFFMGLFGWWMSKTIVKYRKSVRDPFNFMIYSLIVAVTFQLLIRGYTPTNFYLVMVLIIPCILFKKLNKKVVVTNE